MAITNVTMFNLENECICRHSNVDYRYLNDDTLWKLPFKPDIDVCHRCRLGLRILMKPIYYAYMELWRLQ